MKPDYRKCMRDIVRNPAWVAFTWLGMTIGVSMLATPARFYASTITRPVALDVGRTVFSVLNKAEFVALIMMLIIVRVSAEAKRLWIPVFALALILIAQSAWLLPELSARTDLIIAGTEPEPSIAHGAYSTLELMKFGLLAWVGFRSLIMLRE